MAGELYLLPIEGAKTQQVRRTVHRFARTHHTEVKGSSCLEGGRAEKGGALAKDTSFLKSGPNWNCQHLRRVNCAIFSQNAADVGKKQKKD